MTVVLVLDVREAVVRTRRRSSLSRRSTDLEMIKKVRLVSSEELQFLIMIALSQKFGGNLANITAGDLLNKSQEELVLILIQLRRQSASLLEAIDACKAEQDNMRNLGHQPSLDLRQHTWELEEQLARVNPVINLVDNMVKLGTLYRGPDVNAPLSQRLSDLQREEAEEKLVDLQTEAVIRLDQVDVENQQQVLERELARVQNQLEISHKVRDERKIFKALILYFPGSG